MNEIFLKRVPFACSTQSHMGWLALDTYCLENPVSTALLSSIHRKASGIMHGEAHTLQLIAFLREAGLETLLRLQLIGCLEP